MRDLVLDLFLKFALFLIKELSKVVGTSSFSSNDNNNDGSSISIINTSTSLQFHYNHYYGYCYYSTL